MECLTLALKGRCQNQLKRRQTGPERFLGNGRLTGGGRGGPSGSRLLEQAIGGVCEVNFLPLVAAVGDNNRTQRLRCVGKNAEKKSSLVYSGMFLLLLQFPDGFSTCCLDFPKTQMCEDTDH